jgi:nickel superoxide dismutase
MINIRNLINLIPAKTVYAHCDIPCKIYDPHLAQVAAHSVIRMTQMLEEIEDEKDSVVRESQIARLTKVKEDHAELVKHEVRIIWGDYFKAEQIKQIPKIHELVHEIMILASKARQEINMEASKLLLSKVQEFSEVFYKTKGFEVVRIPSGFPTEGEIVSHK